MINEERLKPMIKMAIFDKNEGKTCKPMIEYQKSDYISLQVLKSFISGSIAYVLLVGMWVLYDTDRTFEMLNASDIVKFLTTILILYGVFLIIYLSSAYLVYRFRYIRGRKLVKNYCKNLKEINQVYKREEKLKAPSQKELE